MVLVPRVEAQPRGPNLEIPTIEVDPRPPLIHTVDEWGTMAVRVQAGTPNQGSNQSHRLMVELEELKKSQQVYADAVSLLARENQDLKDRIAQSTKTSQQLDEANSKAP